MGKLLMAICVHLHSSCHGDSVETLFFKTEIGIKDSAQRNFLRDLWQLCKVSIIPNTIKLDCCLTRLS